MCVKVFAVYCVLMAWLLFARERLVTGEYWTQLEGSVNLVPFQTVRRYYRLLTGPYSNGLKHHAWINLLGNVVLFLPLGVFLPLLWQEFRTLWRCILKGGVVVVCVELTQLFLLVGRCDVDDLMLNVFGIAAGYGVFRLMKAENSS